MVLTYGSMFKPYIQHLTMNVLPVIFPQVRAEIVRLLFADQSKALHLRELSRASKLAVGTLQIEVKKLVAAELLIAERDGNRLYFRANSAHPIFPELQGLALKTTGLREQLATALAGLSGIRLAFVFGSQASGAANAASDVDLLIIGAVGLRTLAPKLRPAAETLGREINPHVMAPNTFGAKARAKDAFVASVLASPKIWIIGGPDELGTLV